MSRPVKAIFHYPGRFHEIKDSGEKLRPPRMYEALREICDEVVLINGTPDERKNKISAIIPRLDKFSFLYSENSTLPLRFCAEPPRPLIPSPDYRLFNAVAKKNVPIGVFYRDIFWRYGPFIKQVGLLKYLLGLPFYRRELKTYSKLANKIFIPSERMKHLFPKWVPAEKIEILPPGGAAADPKPSVKYESNHQLQLLYVGSITPPKYDLSPLRQALTEIPDGQIKLDIVTRQEEWKQHGGKYDFPSTVEFHAGGEDTENLYRQADAALLFFNDDDEYMRMAMPVKLFEAISHGLPIICHGDTAAGAFVRDNNIGWMAPKGEGGGFLRHLSLHPAEIAEKAANIIKIRDQHTWSARAAQIAAALSESTEKTP